jgi:polyisoprenyl-teichoic acid--peptidoglycan teichoic acid transferase
MGRDFKKRKINLLDNESVEQPIINVHPEVKDVSQTPTFIKKSKEKTSGKKSKSSSRRKKFSCFFIVLIITFTLVSLTLSSDNNSFLSGIKNGYLFRQISNIISSKEKYIAGEKEDRINFVLLGMGGPGHNGPYLTDTIIVASFKPSTKQAAMFSIPRDMIVPLEKNDYRKVNSIYTVGEQQEIDNGGPLVKEVISKTLNMPIHYFAAVDFNGFVEMIDAVDGIEIDVERSFVDHQFPTYDEKWQSVSFEAGVQEMDGLTALRYARSRHGNNGEGSDFARIKRQQNILMAAKNKLTSFNTLINPQKITSLFSLFNQYTTTDLEPWEAVKLVHMAKGINTQQIINQSIDDRPGGYLKAGISQTDGAYILQPVTGNFSQVRMLVQNIFDLGESYSENAHIVMQNGTAIPGLALEAVNHLEQMGFDIMRYGNASSQDKVTTVIYQYNDNKPQTAKTLEGIFQTKVNTKPPLEYSDSVIASSWGIKNKDGDLERLDFLVILGMDQEPPESVEIIATIDPSLLNASTTSSTDAIIIEE